MKSDKTDKFTIKAVFLPDKILSFDAILGTTFKET